MGEKKIFMMQYDFWQIAVALNLQLKIKKKSNQSGFWWNISKDFKIPIPISLANKEIQRRKSQNILNFSTLFSAMFNCLQDRIKNGD